MVPNSPDLHVFEQGLRVPIESLEQLRERLCLCQLRNLVLLNISGVVQLNLFGDGFSLIRDYLNFALCLQNLRLVLYTSSALISLSNLNFLLLNLCVLDSVLKLCRQLDSSQLEEWHRDKCLRAEQTVDGRSHFRSDFSPVGKKGGSIVQSGSSGQLIHGHPHDDWLVHEAVGLEQASDIVWLDLVLKRDLELNLQAVLGATPDVFTPRCIQFPGGCELHRLHSSRKLKEIMSDAQPVPPSSVGGGADDLSDRRVIQSQFSVLENAPGADKECQKRGKTYQPQTHDNSGVHAGGIKKA
mmetsp:Transcript_35866/g.76129  ORF Transcript_35866/g.76129 Transcript_35866/m.76129 type:complete len:298 (+) Transcript_35866:113-1006(+)